jgi:hypothetical protein
VAGSCDVCKTRFVPAPVRRLACAGWRTHRIGSAANGSRP